MSWNDEQQRILRALGHEVLMPVGAVAASAPASPSMVVAQPEAPPMRRDASEALAVLAAALTRAAGGRDLSALALDLVRLRGEPALKRALWPRLRALRREH